MLKIYIFIVILIFGINIPFMSFAQVSVLVDSKCFTIDRSNSKWHKNDTLPASVVSGNFDSENVSSFPNPASSEIDFIMNIEEYKIESVKIDDFNGKVVFNFNSENIKSKIRWNLIDQKGQKVPSGIYFLIIKTKTHILSHKFIIKN